MEVWTHAESQHSSIQHLRGQPLNVWSCEQTPVVAAVVRIRIVGDCLLDDIVGKHRRVDTGLNQRGTSWFSRPWTYRCDNVATSNIPISRFWVFHLSRPHVKQELSGFSDTLKSSWCFVVDYNLRWIVSGLSMHVNFA